MLLMSLRTRFLLMLPMTTRMQMKTEQPDLMMKQLLLSLQQLQMKSLLHKKELTTADIDKLVDFAKRAGGIDYTYATMERLRADADAILEPYEPNKTIDSFKQIFKFIIQRKN